jgi:hypothetical protein
MEKEQRQATQIIDNNSGRAPRILSNRRRESSYKSLEPEQQFEGQKETHAGLEGGAWV